MIVAASRVLQGQPFRLRGLECKCIRHYSHGYIRAVVLSSHIDDILGPDGEVLAEAVRTGDMLMVAAQQRVHIDFMLETTTGRCLLDGQTSPDPFSRTMTSHKKVPA